MKKFLILLLLFILGTPIICLIYQINLGDKNILEAQNFCNSIPLNKTFNIKENNLLIKLSKEDYQYQSKPISVIKSAICVIKVDKKNIVIEKRIQILN